jgi:hypothetical protein
MGPDGRGKRARECGRCQPFKGNATEIEATLPKGGKQGAEEKGREGQKGRELTSTDRSMLVVLQQ